ncbi:2-oxo acid dehydrogenase subunit E2 [Companilactobacillus allii]|uniref:Dihydrolipoamide acetyltransferase component of pyruvate dehydrogenase complex n=1 Tax=Companilactobacillus allii TaxID=1847728 RepID=A0A1P8Q5A3_9LACO|nr:2-oxo acid dehydrogenase subunit E2 [Companilactobacillus allii]APX73026.1 branched-chain alpha-keto acid dehydrogenase subunit E2 [Companilactobacillus allii]USQ67823.1 2-oxo acid dehydrogenase subunit E2 [Companilactobacillus allii]
MAYKFKLPELGEGMAEGEIASWLVKEGDTIKEDDSIVEIQNDKSVEELPSPVSGTVKQIVAQEGDTVEIGDTLIVIDDGSADTGDDEEAPKADKAPEKADAPADKSAEKAPSQATGSANDNYLAMPSVRQYARDEGVDLSLVTPSGKHGQISKEDIDSYKAGAPAKASKTEETPAKASGPAVKPYKSDEPELETREKMSMTRKAIAKAMRNSKDIAPHVTSFDDVEVSVLMANRKKYKSVAADKGIKLTFLPYIVKALVAVMKEYPEFNASIDNSTDEIVYKHYYNVGIATNTEHGLYVPNIKNADSKGMFEIAKEITENTQAAYDNKLNSKAMSGGSITISNVGSIGGGWFTPVINQPEVAILGVGKIANEPYVDEDGNIQVGKMLKLSLSYDHRLIDGALAQNALNLLKKLLHEPDMLLMEG